MRGWTLEDIPWRAFDPAKVDPVLLKAVKAAALVEHNATDYKTYLNNVFHDDPEFQAAAEAWSREEIQHGLALGRWAEMADPEFDFQASFRRFAEGYRLPLDLSDSVRGSRGGEMVARCVVEAGTSSFYSAIHDATDEPVLKEIARLIAADEFRHYKLFYVTLRKYLEREPMGSWRRSWVVLRRLLEKDDDELAYAYYSANHGAEAYDRRQCGRAYEARACQVFRIDHLRRGLAMVMKAAGLRPRGLLGRVLGQMLWLYLGFRRRQLRQLTT